MKRKIEKLTEPEVRDVFDQYDRNLSLMRDIRAKINEIIEVLNEEE